MPIEIRTATTADIAEMSAMMARAFQDDDPVSEYFFPDASSRPSKQRRMMAALIRHRYIPAGGADLAVENGRIVGVSLWHPHDAPATPRWRQLVSGPHLLWAMGSGTRAGIEMDRLLTENSPPPTLCCGYTSASNRPHTDPVSVLRCRPTCRRAPIARADLCTESARRATSDSGRRWALCHGEPPASARRDRRSTCSRDPRPRSPSERPDATGWPRRA